MPHSATSSKPPAVKTAVTAQYAEGKANAEIARELQLDRETVTRILNEPESKEAVEASRARVMALLPKAEKAVEQWLDKGDGNLGLRLLEKSGVLVGECTASRQHPKESLAMAFQQCQPVIQQALNFQPAQELKPIDKPSAGSQSVYCSER